MRWLQDNYRMIYPKGRYRRYAWIFVIGFHFLNLCNKFTPGILKAEGV
jgi:hypothetical protein